MSEHLTPEQWRRSDSATLIDIREHLDDAVALEKAAQLTDALAVMRHAAAIANGSVNDKCPYCLLIEDEPA